jgi:hypothetical protein
MGIRRAAIALLIALMAHPSAAQPPVDPPIVSPTDRLAFDRPEAWALKHFDSATVLSGLETPRTLAPGSISLGVELGSLPTLSPEQRRVGFGGTKEEDLNKAPVFFRLRVTVGLPKRLSLVVAAVPPIRAFGTRPKLLAVGLGRPVYENDRWAVGVRGYGQVGNADAAFTCPPKVLAFTPGSAENSYGCQSESSDTATLRYIGGEVSLAYRPGGRTRVLSPHAAAGVNYFDLAFQVNALTFDYIDHTHLISHGATFSTSGGVSYPLGKRFDATLDLFYTPLSVRRPVGSSPQNDGLFNVRLLVTYRLR